MKLFAKKSLGQHFLNSKHVLDQIIAAGNIQKDQNILEIGPGTGILTSELLKAGAHVIAIEKDDRAYELLKERFSHEIMAGALELIRGDILDQRLIEAHISPLASFSIIANIPYYITGAILEQFLEHGPRPDTMVLLVQKEVAERIVARPEQQSDKSKESVLSISVKAFGEPQIVARVSKGAFNPPPSVDSAIIKIRDISDKSFQPLLERRPDAISMFFKLVKAGFAHKRKILRRNLEEAADAEALSSIWSKLGFDPNVRAEDITPQDWLSILNQIS